MSRAPVAAAQRRRTRGAPLLGAALALFAACGSGAAERPAGPELQVEDVWARPAMAADDVAAPGAGAGHGSGGNSAVYLTMRNTGGGAERLVGVESRVARATEVHHTRVEDGVMRMRPVEGGVAIGPGESVEFRPGGLHVMLIDLHRSLEPGDRFPLALHFERGGSHEVEVEVRTP